MSIAKTKKSAAKTIPTALQILHENNNEYPRKFLIKEIEKRVQFEDWELEKYESNQQLKWITIFLYYTIDCIKAGWLKKNKGIWYLTPEGEKALKLDPITMIDTAGKAYRSWVSNSKDLESDITEGNKDEVNITNEKVQQLTIEEQEELAIEGIGKYLEALGGYDFQHLVAVLLKAMNHYVDYEAPPGKDGGIDIIAFGDPLGYTKPRIKVQVKKHKENNTIDVKQVRELKGLLHAGEDIGIFVTSGYFSKPAEDFVRSSDTHIKLIDRDKFIELWIQHYSRFSDEEKKLLPLHPIYFLGIPEQL